MSDDVLKIIPHDPEFVPEASTYDQAVALLGEILPDGEMCEAKAFDRLEFIDPGANLEAVVCPACGVRLELDPFTEEDPGMAWWYNMQDSMQDSSVESVATALPCCRTVVPFKTLQFDWPAGFARFELSIWNPGIARNLNDEELGELETIFGCKLKQVRAHY